jgi:L-lactate dehydrogenase complex protein LldG
MNSRDSILARIRKALTVAPAQFGHQETRASVRAGDAEFRAVLPAVGKNADENLALFARNAGHLHAEFNLVKGMDEAITVLKELAQVEKWDRVASHRGKLTDLACEALGLPVYSTQTEFEKELLEKCPVGISECDALIAQTGSVLVTSRSAGGRALSVLPPHHVVLARRDQLIPGLPDAFALLRARYGSAFPSMISFITGPSRTGDIERILVLGAHGPKRLTILCL